MSQPGPGVRQAGQAAHVAQDDAAWQDLRRLERRYSYVGPSDRIDAFESDEDTRDSGIAARQSIEDLLARVDRGDAMPHSLDLYPAHDCTAEAAVLRQRRASLQFVLAGVEHLRLSSGSLLVAPWEYLGFLFQAIAAVPRLRSLTLTLDAYVDPVCLADAFCSPDKLLRLEIRVARSVSPQRLARMLDLLLARTRALQVLRLISFSMYSWLPCLVVVKKHRKVLGDRLAALTVKSGTHSTIKRSVFWAFLTRELLPCFPNLLDLRLWHYVVASSDTAQWLADMTASCTRLRLLQLVDVVCSAEAGAATARLLARTPHLQRLDLMRSTDRDWNSCLQSVLTQDVLCRLRQLRRLCLVHCALRDPGISALASALPGMPQLLALDLSYNQIVQLGQLLPVLRCVPQLRRLGLEGNALPSQDCLALTAELRWLPKLVQLPLHISAASLPVLIRDVLPCTMRLESLHLSIPRSCDESLLTRLGQQLPWLQELTHLWLAVNIQPPPEPELIHAVTTSCVTRKPRLGFLAFALSSSYDVRLRDALAQALADCLDGGAAPSLMVCTLRHVLTTSACSRAVLQTICARNQKRSWSARLAVHIEMPDVLPDIVEQPACAALATLGVPVPGTQRYGLADAREPPVRLWTLYELAASVALNQNLFTDDAVAGEGKSSWWKFWSPRPDRVTLPQDVNEPELRRRLRQCLQCSRWVDEPRAGFAWLTKLQHQHVFVEACMCSHCYHTKWLVRTDVDHSVAWMNRNT